MFARDDNLVDDARSETSSAVTIPDEGEAGDPGSESQSLAVLFLFQIDMFVARRPRLTLRLAGVTRRNGGTVKSAWEAFCPLVARSTWPRNLQPRSVTAIPMTT